MKYESKRKAASDGVSEIYLFSVGKHELEILMKLCHLSYQNTPKTIQNLQYHARLRNLVKVFGKMWSEDVGGKSLPKILNR